MKYLKFVIILFLEIFALTLLHCFVWVSDRLALIKKWCQEPLEPVYLRLGFIYIAGGLLLGIGYWIGFLGPIVVSSGWVGKVVGSLVLCHVVLAFYIVGRVAPNKTKLDTYSDFCDYTTKKSKTNGLVNWLDKIDSSILALGFLGKLYAIATILKAVNGTDAASIAIGLKNVSNGVSVALFSTMMGLGLSLWTHCGTLVVSNKLDQDDS
jgi:hypothetical protein